MVLFFGLVFTIYPPENFSADVFDRSCVIWPIVVLQTDYFDEIEL